ncbi:MAG: glycosyltransferase, partial [Spirochaetales bacterium]|nr:glycosyltransferase [Spirochaetales bacterium]
MNIALFTDSYTPVKNGVVTSVRQLKEGLESRGHNVIVITAEVPYYQDTESGIYRLPSVPAKLGAGTEFRFSMINQSPINKFLKKRKIDIIHTHSEFSIGFCGKRAAKKLKVPLVHTTHTMWENYTHYLMNGKLITPKMARKYMAMYLKNVTQIVAPSVKAKNYYSQIVPNKPIEIVPNGIDSDKFKSSEIKPDEINQLRKEFGIKKNDINLIFVGRVGQEKRVDELFATAAPILKKYDNL